MQLWKSYGPPPNQDHYYTIQLVSQQSSMINELYCFYYKVGFNDKYITLTFYLFKSRFSKNIHLSIL